jgi:hypothetical protein
MVLACKIREFFSNTKILSYVYLLTPDIPPFNRKYKGRKQPFFGIDDRIPLLLTLLLGFQHALAMMGGGT